MNFPLFGPIEETLPPLLEKRKEKIALIVDAKVHALFEKKIESISPSIVVTVQPGEESKTRAEKERIEDVLFDAGYSRDTLILAIGGGMVADLAGFVAATFCRGVPHILIPTTLLAMCDAAIGGKVAVNHPKGKNLIGAFYPAVETLIDESFLATLPEREYRSGVVEMLKHGLVFDAAYFKTMNRGAIPPDIIRSVEIKTAIVERDPFEKGLRRILNFGHTVGHAIESALKFQITHGEAVLLGMRVETLLSKRLSTLDDASFKEIDTLLKKIEIPAFSLPDPKTLFSLMCLDKKGALGQPRVVCLKKIGQPDSFSGAYTTPLTEEVFREAYSLIFP